MSDDLPPLPQYPRSDQLPQFPRSSGLPNLPPRDPRGEPPPAKTQAIWALCLSFIPGGITLVIAVALAINVLVDSHREKRDYGRKQAIAALVMVGAWVVILGVVLVYWFTGRAERDESGGVTQAGRVQVVDLAVGDCLAEPPEEDNVTIFVDVVPCSEAHTSEVFAAFALETFEDIDTVDALVQRDCLDRFADYVGDANVSPDLQLFYFLPQTRQSFNEDPSVVCLAYSEEALTGPIQDLV